MSRKPQRTEASPTAESPSTDRPRPNKAPLIATALMLGGWTVFLLVLAVAR